MSTIIHWGQRLREAARYGGVSANDIARELQIQANSVRAQWLRAPADEGTIARYCRAMNAELERRNVPLRFTPERLVYNTTPALETATPTPQAPRTVPYRGPVPGPLTDSDNRLFVLAEQLDPLAWRDESCFLVRAAGDALERFGLGHLDLLAVDPDRTAQSGQLVLVALGAGAAVRKLRARADGGWELLPGREEDDTVVVGSRDELQLLGVVLGVLPAARRLV